MLSYIEEINRYLSGAVVPLLLCLSGAAFLVYLRAFHLRHPILLLRSMVRREGRSEGGISPFRAVTLALAGTLGVGNLVGVSGAIFFGGPGAVFWMLLSAFLAMLLKYAEIVLALRHRVFSEKGEPRGGAMYYIRDYFQSIGLPRFGLALAAIFAVLCVVDSLTMGCVIQMNAVGSAFSGVFGLHPLAVGGLLALLIFVIVCRGGRTISALTERLVPLMTLLYLVLSITVLVLRRSELPGVVRAVIADAFHFDSAVLGISAFLLSRAARYGTMRGLMSNEAGCGTAPIAHAESRAKYPAEQGIWGIFEVFADTILLCTMTAAVVLVSYGEVERYGEDSMMMTIKAYSAVLGGWSEPVFAFLVLFFAFATVICWAHYGRSALGYLTPEGKARGLGLLYTLLLSVTAIYGATAAPGEVWAISDLALGIMTVLNLVVLWMMRREVKAETVRYLAILKRDGGKKG